MNDLKLSPSSAPWRHKLREIIFEAETPAGRAFDIALFLTIGLSTLIVILESVGNIRANYRLTFLILEWCITGLFTVEYFLRLLSVYHPARYAISFGIIAVPTGIVTIELSRATRTSVSTQACPVCGQESHDYDAVYCKYCGAKL